MAWGRQQGLGIGIDMICRKRCIQILLVALAVLADGVRGQSSNENNASLPGTATTQQSGNSTVPAGYQFPLAGVRFRNYLRDTSGPFTLIYVAGRAGIAHWWDDPPEWSGRMKGYSQRLASTYGIHLAKKTMEYGFNEVLLQDSRFYRCACEGFWTRLGYTMKSTFTAHTREGRVVFSVPALASNYAAEVIAATAWYPNRYTYKDGLREGTWALLGRFGINLAREFLRRH
jgi:hypothetical protein